ncbi:MAG: HTTM domain-containing protein [bacterium]
MNPSTALPARLREPGSPAHAALLRVALGLHLLAVLQSPAIDLLVDIRPELHPQARVIGGATAFAALSPALVATLRDVGLVAAALFVLGLGGRLTTLVLLGSFTVTQYFWFGATLFHDDWIYFTFPLLAFLCLTHPTAFSLDARLRRRPSDPDTERREARLLIEAWVFWIGFVYLAAGIAKLFPLTKGIDWLSGIAAQHFALEFVRQSPAIALFGEPVIPLDARWIFALGAIATVIVELGAAALWFTRRAYLPVATAIFAMHLGIWLTGIPAFIGMFSVLALSLLPRHAFTRADAWRDTRRAPPAPEAAPTAAPDAAP